MVFQGRKEETATDTSMNNTKKLTPGPYKATKLWNGIVQGFREEMNCKKHRRHLKTYNTCFTATEAVDFLHEHLKSNCNIGKDVTRQQTIQLLRKFLKNHVIEDVQGRWGSENFEDDGRLFRFPPGISIAQALRQPLGALDSNVYKSDRKSNTKKQKRKSKAPVTVENNNAVSEEKKIEESEKFCTIRSSSTSSTTSQEHLKRPLPPVPVIPKCRVISQPISEADVQDTWKKILLTRLRETLHLDNMDDVLIESEISGDSIRHNATRVGKSGVVQVEKDEDLPYWALSAMTCLANWPNSKDTGLPCYPGFEKDVFRAVCDYYCGVKPTSSYVTYNNGHSLRRPPHSYFQPEPLITYEYYELFTNIVCLIQPASEKIAINALQLALLMIPPANRRKLHLLLRLMSKMCSNPHLSKLGGILSTKTLLLQTFSRYILSCNEEVYLDELLAMRLVSFLMDNHAEVLKVPACIQKSVDEKIERMRKPDIRYSESGEGTPYMHYVLASNHEAKMRLRSEVHNERRDKYKRKSTDIMKSWDKLVTSIKNKPPQSASSSTDKSDSSDTESYIHLRKSRIETKPCQLREAPRRFRQRTNTVGNRCFIESSPEESHRTQHDDLNEPRIKPAKSCSDIFDMKIPSTSGKLNQKSSEMGSSWNLRLRPKFGKPFSKLRRSKV